MTMSSDMLAAALFLVAGAAAVFLGLGYGLGTPSQLGSGALPCLAGAALCLMGVAQFLDAMRASRIGEGSPPAFAAAELRPLLLVLAAVTAFAVLIIPAGLVPALAVQILIAWFAQKGGRGWEIAGAMIAVILLIILIFKFGLGLPLRLFPAGF